MLLVVGRVGYINMFRFFYWRVSRKCHMVTAINVSEGLIQGVRGPVISCIVGRREDVSRTSMEVGLGRFILVGRVVVGIMLCMVAVVLAINRHSMVTMALISRDSLVISWPIFTLFVVNSVDLFLYKVVLMVMVMMMSVTINMTISMTYWFSVSADALCIDI